jgi:DNA-binding winged helix-turn-helix (wHTH) protein/Flp pilus assembly protein TadD
MLATGPLDCSPVVLAREQPFRIGKAEFRPATREVFFAGESFVIEPRVMQLLVALRRAKGGLVSKVDLADLCWEGRIVGDDAIHRVVSRLRSVAEKHAGGEFHVETVKKVGYRLVYAKTAVEPAEGNWAHLKRRELVIGSSAAMLAGAAGIGWVAFVRSGTPRAARLLVDNARKSLREGDLGDAVNAVGTLREATRLAPESAEAWGLLAFALVIAAIDASAQERPGLQARGIAAMRRAFAIEPYQADALAARVRTISMFRNWDRYEQACRAALRHHPAHPELLVELAGVLAEVGRLGESLALYDKAKSSMPLSADVLARRTFLLQSLGRLDEADAAVENAFNLLPRNYTVWNARAFYLMFSGRAREAAEMFGDKESRPAFDQDEEYDLDILQANAIASGDRAQIRKALDTLVGVAESGRGFVMATALFAAYVGELDQAFRLLNALYLNRGFTFPGYLNRANSGWGGELHTEHLFTRPMASLRRDPRFATLTRDLGLVDYWQRTRSRSRVIS